MELYVFIFMFNALVSSEVKVVHEDFVLSGCSDTDKEFMYGSDGEELYHIDFIKQRGVLTLPNFADPLSYSETYEQAFADIEVCKKDLPTLIKLYKYPKEELAKPETSIYSEDDVQLGVENILICHVTGFFPPAVTVSWTKNNKILKGFSLSQYRPRNDLSFNIFSTLKILPEEGDIYSCTVNHRSLEGQLQTKTWEVEVALPSVGPAVFCGLGLTLGLLGVAAGTFFFIKGNNCRC